MNIVVQILGLLALMLVVLSYQKKTKEKFLKLQLFANITYGLQYFLLNAKSAFFTNIVNDIRTLIFYRIEKNNQKISLWLLIIFEIVIISIGFFTYEGYYSIIPIIIACLYAYGTWHYNLKVTYIIGIISSILWVYYNFQVGAYTGALSSIFEFMASVLGLYKIRNIDKVI